MWGVATTLPAAPPTPCRARSPKLLQVWLILDGWLLALHCQTTMGGNPGLVLLNQSSVWINKMSHISLAIGLHTEEGINKEYRHSMKSTMFAFFQRHGDAWCLFISFDCNRQNSSAVVLLLSRFWSIPFFFFLHSCFIFSCVIHKYSTFSGYDELNFT